LSHVESPDTPAHQVKKRALMRALAETLCQLLEFEMRHGFASIDNTMVLLCSSGLVGASCAHRVPVFLRFA